MYNVVPISPEQFFFYLTETAEDNHNEIEPDVPFNPDQTMYRTLYEAGLIFGVAMFDEDDNCVGYCVVVSSPSLHSKGSHTTQVDTIYIKPEHRSLKAFTTLLREVEALVKESGVKTLSIVSNQARPIDKLLSRYGYKHIETTFRKEL